MREATYPLAESAERMADPHSGRVASYLVLQAVGFALPTSLPTPRCALTAPFHHCLPHSLCKFNAQTCLLAAFSTVIFTFLPASSNPQSECGVGCVFSVALSRGLPRVAVSHHRALSCSDFPPAFTKASGRPTHSFN